ncbi:4-amino-4-deoxy-L-arabinose transferase-like glycosyltransferase [Breznakia sp. PF5-3]|uniref:hypothetical protein n=1 Tax=unclassified Breznakia TaxID=2623764 RepID=UPI0024064F26|nr:MULTISPECIES: hypothetical protein [unclassified Breznakia]MDF9824983.1 4-amino-4-deoxy-L-arabinose transferase-like glycosyltransferase [Breznakia sp. PM6-1]MDF9835824.1 4-amino-4-deoxy-L-arabinose transferase-like glycosyltransferase [Breznakia sp. PF5-3]
MIKNKVKEFFIKNKVVIFWIMLFCIYSVFSVTIYVDSSHYMSYVSIFEGNTSFAEWDIIRGPVFPFIIYLSRRLFGSSHISLVLITFIFYAIMIIIIHKLLSDIVKNIKNKYFKKGIYVLGMCFVIFNPLVFGYYHALLTEFVAMTIAISMCYLAWKWIDMDFFKNKKCYLIASAVFVFFTVFSWHLKQPYVATTIFPLLIATVISLFQNHTLKNFGQRGIMLLCCFAFLFTSVKVWNIILVQGAKQNLNTDRNIVGNFGGQILSGPRNFNVMSSYDDLSDVLDNDIYLSQDEKQLVIEKIENNEVFFLVDVLSPSNEIIDREVIDFKGAKALSFSSALSFVISEFFANPASVIDGYKTGYFILADVYKTEKNENGGYKKEFTLGHCRENCSIAGATLRINGNIIYMPDEYYERVKEYNTYNHPPMILRSLMSHLFTPAQYFYSIGIILLPFLWIIAIALRFLRRKKTDLFENKENNLLIILLGFSFMNALVYVFTANTIDRYMAVTLVPMIISLIIFIKKAVMLKIR